MGDHSPLDHKEVPHVSTDYRIRVYDSKLSSKAGKTNPGLRSPSTPGQNTCLAVEVAHVCRASDRIFVSSNFRSKPQSELIRYEIN